MHRRILPPIGSVVASIAILSFALLGAACEPGASTSATPPTPTVPPTADRIFDRAEHSEMKNARVDFSANGTTSQGNEVTNVVVTGQGELISDPAASHFTLKMTLSGNVVYGTVTDEYIAVGGKTYTKTLANVVGRSSNSSAKYTVTDTPDGPMPLLPTATQSNLQIVGEDIIRGDRCWHLSGIETTNADGMPVPAGTSGATTTHLDTWIRKSDYYYVRLKMDSLPAVFGSFSDAGSNPSDTSTYQIDLSQYDRKVTISPPPADQTTSVAPAYLQVGDQVHRNGV